MTAAAREVGHKEIAALRATTEATVRQQAQSIYRKASLPGNTAFSAYFLEDIFSLTSQIDGTPALAAAKPSPSPTKQVSDGVEPTAAEHDSRLV